MSKLAGPTNTKSDRLDLNPNLLSESKYQKYAVSSPSIAPEVCFLLDCSVAVHIYVPLLQPRLHSSISQQDPGQQTQSVTVQHFKLDCFVYAVERQELFTNISGLLIKKLDKYNRCDLVAALLFGENLHDSERYQHNKLLFRSFQNFLINTKRLCFKSKLQYTIN